MQREPVDLSDLTKYWVNKEGFKDERSGKYYLKEPRRWSFEEGTPNLTAPQKKVPPSWKGPSLPPGSSSHGTDSSWLERVGDWESQQSATRSIEPAASKGRSKNCFKPVYRWWQGLSPLTKVLIGVATLVFGIIIGVVIYDQVK